MLRTAQTLRWSSRLKLGATATAVLATGSGTPYLFLQLEVDKLN